MTIQNPEVVRRYWDVLFLRAPDVSALLAWIKECEKPFDLSDPLASNLFLPAKGKNGEIASCG